ncbi:HAD-IA family hydrolase [Arenicella xantha]|uniref:Phosphoglycolate phosphatase n=1 Tax=Arenicella xantha TaxID=644221 RepID=A0A395JL39_9GAMM|nr:HAD-IA family hydrolase [Arenicella xantha]RBP51506.1 phosphoglycolate phosphatase [Arenicella xantha]
MQMKALLLDLDGTLVDTAPDMVGALNRVLKKHKRDACNPKQASKVVSNGARALIEHGFSETLSEASKADLVQEFLTVYQQYVCVESHLYDGMSETLALCEENQLRWGIITNKPLHLAKEVVDGLGLLERCAILLGGDSLPVKKPDPVPMLHSCMVLSLAPSECLYVGDHERDIQAGNAAGMDTAAALWGYIGDQEDPSQWNARYQIGRPQGLINLINDKLAL